MPIPDGWAQPEDFASLFQYLWHRDFPLGQGAVGARRADWTIHIGLVVRSIGDLMGLVTRFESGGRKDALLRSADGDEVAIEWEWGRGWQRSELPKLKEHKVFSPSADSGNLLKYAVLVAYCESKELSQVIHDASSAWSTAKWPLLLILVDSASSRQFSSGRIFGNLNFFLISIDGQHKKIREAPAYPWSVGSTRWQVGMLWNQPIEIRRLLEKRNPNSED